MWGWLARAARDKIGSVSSFIVVLTQVEGTGAASANILTSVVPDLLDPDFMLSGFGLFFFVPITIFFLPP